MHRHARGWSRPGGFTRFHWDHEAALGAGSRWGRWQDGLGVDAEALGRAGAAGQGAARAAPPLRPRPGAYGLIHADLRAANLLVEGEDPPGVIDFDDCGFGWHLYDLAAAVSFVEHRPEVPELVDAWAAGLPDRPGPPGRDEAEIWTFILFRRLLLVAWIGTHTGADIAAGTRLRLHRGSCELAERYLAGSLG